MRIFEALEATANPYAPGNRTWRRNLYEPLIEMGHEVLLFSTTPARVAMLQGDTRHRSRFSESLLNTFRFEHARRPFDLFFAYLMDGMVDPEVIDEIRKTGVPTCNFSCNNAHQFDNVDELSPHFDLNLHSEKDARDKFLAIRATPFWWPMASNPNYFKPLNLARSISVSFVGANYSLRARYIAHLLEHGVEVHAYGPGWIGGATKHWRSMAKRYKYLSLALWPLDRQRQSQASNSLAEHDFRRFLTERFPENFHAPVSDDTLIELYSRSHISLGFLEVHDRHDPTRPLVQHLHLRDFEGPMSGALYCTGYMDELAEMFDSDKEVVVYRNQFELLDKVRFYLSHPAEAELIRLAGRARALAQHTYTKRFEKLFDRLGMH
jgi:hypothetical protein